MSSTRDLVAPHDTFARRHLGPDSADTAAMLRLLDQPSLEALADAAVPPQIRLPQALNLPAAAGESAALAELRTLAAENQVFRSFIGQGYYDTLTPAVIQRNILENPGWYTAYTPYQAEISQGRLEALLNFQTMICDLTGLEIANASMLDEGTAAAEAMMLCHRLTEGATHVFFVSDACHPQTIDVVRTRAQPLGIEIVVGDHRTYEPAAGLAGVLVQYPDTWGNICDFAGFFAKVHAAGAHCVVAADLAPTSLLAPLSALACRWGLADRMRDISPHGMPANDRCPAASWACPKTSMEIPPCGSRWARANSISAAKRPRPTSAPRKFCSPSWRRCTRCTTARTGSAASPSGCVC
jgi:glycine dehydrogenase